MVRKKHPKFDLKLHNKRVIEVSLIISLLLVAALLLSFKQIKFERTVPAIPEGELIPVVPRTEQIKSPPPPARPSIPVESDDPELDDDVTIEDVEWDIFDKPPPPPPAPDEVVDFYAVEVRPELIGGGSSIVNYIVERDLYPEMARMSGISGKVQLEFIVRPNGSVSNIVVLDERPRELGFGDAAVEAIANMRFTPGQQRDKFVSVRMTQIIKFKI